MGTDINELSIIVPNYNNWQYIEYCITSILKQTYRNYEIIVADDCSNDKSIDIIKKFEKKFTNINAVYHDKNNGVSFNRHSAISKAKGEYITTLDSDDIYYNPRKLEREVALVKLYKEKHNKDICAFSNTVLLTESLKFIKERGNKDTIKEGMIFDNIITRTCEIPRDFIMSKKSYFDVGGYDMSLAIFEDWDLKIRLAKKYEFYYSGVSGTGHRKHPHGLSSRSFSAKIEAFNNAFYKNLDLVAPEKRDSVQKQFKVLEKNITS